MSPSPPLFFMRGHVYVVNFAGYQKPGEIIKKYAVCLQQGQIAEGRRRFSAILLTTCKDNNVPRMYPWSVYISPTESSTKFGVIADCSELHTFLKADVIDSAYQLGAETMKKIDEALYFGVGLLSLEDLLKAKKAKEQNEQ